MSGSYLVARISHRCPMAMSSPPSPSTSMGSRLLPTDSSEGCRTTMGWSCSIGIQHILTFVASCEGYLGIKPHFELWKYFFAVEL